MIANMSAMKAPSETDSPLNAASLARAGHRSPLQQLLHAFNQPLTGLQCSIDVALACPRPVEYHVQWLREGLQLTERMRALVGAIREVADIEDETNDEPETIELKAILREMVDDLRRVAEARGVAVTLKDSAVSLLVKVGRRRLSTLVFRLVEAVLNLAEQGTTLQIETGGVTDHAWVGIRWIGGPRSAEFSRPELGLLVGQAGWERLGAKWERERTEDLETVTVWLPGISAGGENS
jgi:signal transduction histidine kinase